MKRPVILSFSLILFSVNASAFTCFLTLVKDSCWTDYDVTVNMGNSMTGKAVLKQSVPKGKSYTRQKFDCEAGEVFNFTAGFEPVFWKSDEGKIFKGKRTWALPDKIAKGDTAWNVTICYPEEFAEIPMPPTGSGDCVCNTKDLPPVKAPAKP